MSGLPPGEHYEEGWSLGDEDDEDHEPRPPVTVIVLVVLGVVATLGSFGIRADRAECPEAVTGVVPLVVVSASAVGVLLFLAVLLVPSHRRHWRLGLVGVALCVALPYWIIASGPVGRCG